MRRPMFPRYFLLKVGQNKALAGPSALPGGGFQDPPQHDVATPRHHVDLDQ
jgi:hypothetical protein